MNARDRIPQDLDAERAVIGSALLSESALVTCRGSLLAEDFHDPSNGHVWHAMCELYDRGVRVDRVTVAAELTGLVSNAMPMLAEFELDAPAVSNAGRYAQQVAKLAASRRLIHLAAEMSRSAMEDDPEDVIDRTMEGLQRIEVPSHVGAPSRTLADFGETPYDWLIPNLLERGDRLLITAGEGVGKSMLLRQMAIQAASGIHPFTLQRTRPLNVLLIEFENGERSVIRNLNWLARHSGTFENSRLRIEVRQSGCDMSSRADQAWLMDRVRANGAEMLCIGPIYKMTGDSEGKGDGQGGEKAVLRVTKALDRIRDLGVALVMETHAPHASGFHRDMRPIGSSVWLRWPEFGFGLAQHAEDPRRYDWQGFRGPRDDNREWPAYLMRGLDHEGAWPWSAVMPDAWYGRRRAS